jgi:hypothetical protein
MSKEQEKSPQGDENVSKDPRALGEDPGKKASQAKSKEDGQGKDTEDSFNPKEAYDGLRSLGDKRYNETRELLSSIVDKLDQMTVKPHEPVKPEDEVKVSQEVLDRFVKDPIGTIKEISLRSVSEMPEFKRMIMNSVAFEAKSRYKDFDQIEPYMEEVVAKMDKEDLNLGLKMKDFSDFVYDRAQLVRIKQLAKEGKIKIEGQEAIDKEQLKKGEDLNASSEEAVSAAELEPAITNTATGRRIQDLF